MDNKNKKIKIIIIVVVVLILAGLYLWYAAVYGNKKRITITQRESMSDEYLNVAAKYNITKDYIWLRTKSVMLKDESNDKLVPEYMLVEGKLNNQSAEYSKRYLLLDQALLMKAYLETDNRIAATELKNSVDKYFRLDDGVYVSCCEKDDNGEIKKMDDATIGGYSNIIWLESFLDYYSNYGTKKDYLILKSMVDTLFDEEGNIEPMKLKAQTFVNDNADNIEDNMNKEKQIGIDDESENANIENQSITQIDDLEGVELREIRLSLIADLERNKLLPEGVTDKYFEVILNGIIADDVPLFATSYKYTGDENSLENIEYIYSGTRAGIVDVDKTIDVLYNLGLADKMDNDAVKKVYQNIREQIINSMNVASEYMMFNGLYSGNIDLNRYIKLLDLMCICEDTTSFDVLCTLIGENVATYNASPVLSMLFRKDDENDRFMTYAVDNLYIFYVLS